jgi:hypothetical protein
VHGQGNLKTNSKVVSKVLNKYEVLVTIPHALESVCADGIDRWSQQAVSTPIILAFTLLSG